MNKRLSSKLLLFLYWLYKYVGSFMVRHNLDAG